MGDGADPGIDRPPRSLPPRLVDATVAVVAGLFYGGVLAGDVVQDGWDARLVAAVALSPAVLALWWRRRRPVLVLGAALAATVGLISRVPAEPAGVRELKGRREPVEVYRIGWREAGGE